MRHYRCGKHPEIRDFGGEPYILNMKHAADMNQNFRMALWTGRHLQLTVMSIPACGEIGVEMHPDVDQLLRVESGRAMVCMGSCRGNLREQGIVTENCAIFIPAGTWHNIVNMGKRPLKLSSVYAPPQHPAGTVHRTAEEAGHAGH